MKTFATSIALVLLSHNVVAASTGNSWKFSEWPEDGTTDITFGFAIDDTPHISQYYMAMQYNFFGDGMGYCGLQARPDQGDKQIIHAVFSTFTGDSTTDDDKCHLGADGGGGVSCAADFAGVYGRKYNISIENQDGKWVGTVIDTVDGNSTHIGSWTLPSGRGNLKNYQLGFLERYPCNGGPSCGGIPDEQAYFKGRWFNPTSTSKDAFNGTVYDAHPGKDTDEFFWTQLSDGVLMAQNMSNKVNDTSSTSSSSAPGTSSLPSSTSTSSPEISSTTSTTSSNSPATRSSIKSNTGATALSSQPAATFIKASSQPAASFIKASSRSAATFVKAGTSSSARSSSASSSSPYPELPITLPTGVTGNPLPIDIATSPIQKSPLTSDAPVAKEKQTCYCTCTI